MVSLVTAGAFIISGIVNLKMNELIWVALMNFASAFTLVLFSFSLLFRAKRIFKAPAAYAILYFLGYVLILVGLMTTINRGIWGSGLILLLIPFYLSLRSKKRSDS